LVFYDMRNRGRSEPVKEGERITIQYDVKDLEAIRQHFGFEKMNLIGESYLGLMVAMYALQFPSRVDRIVQIGPVPMKFGTEFPAAYSAGDSYEVMDKAKLEELRALQKQGYPVSHPQEYCEKEWIETRAGLVGDQALAHKLGPGPCEMPNEWPTNLQRHFQFHFTSVQKLDIAKSEFAKIAVPVLTIHGTKDRNAAYGSGREWASTLPNARLLTIEGAAHFPWIDQPETVLGAINSFFGGDWPSNAEKLSQEPAKIPSPGPLAALQFYVGKWRPLPGSDSSTYYDLEWALDKKIIRWTGFLKGNSKPYVEGIMGWDPVDKKIVEYHVYSAVRLGKAELRVLGGNVVERTMEVRQPDGTINNFRDRWTPTGPDTFDWFLEIDAGSRWIPYPDPKQREPLHVRINRSESGDR
jgi:proline iminopeptidase